MGSFTPNGLYKPDVGPPAEKGWGTLVDVNWDLLDPLLGNNAVSQIRTQPPIPLASPNVLTVGTTAVNLSSIAGGIPVGATHALFSVAPPASGGNPNSGNVYLTEDGSTVPVPATGKGAYIAAGFQDEVTNLTLQKVIADQAGVALYPMFRKYPP